MSFYLERSFGKSIPSSFTNKFLGELAELIYKESLDYTRILVGVPFTNGYLGTIFDENRKSYKVLLYPLHPSVLTTSKHNKNYIPPKFYEKGGKTYMQVSSGFEKAIKRLYRNNLSYASQGRAYQKAMLLAPFEGPKIQSIWYLFGGGNSGKSTVVKVCEGFLQSHQIQHMLRRGTRFSNSQLQGAYLVCIDDVQQFKFQEAALLCTLAGRDQIASDVKFQKEVTIEPYCITIMVSNFHPSHFPALQDEAIKKKINLMILDQDYSVNINERVTDFHLDVLTYAHEIYNWILYTPLMLSGSIVLAPLVHRRVLERFQQISKI